ncbi:LysR family nitrogen assimilation transcriptional regulator [Paraburkholderia sp. Clong3]|uniref:Transcriptional regulator, LysR family n=1 Tax=Paraburkholderia tuberum TaxID=157910 RepID=A0A1H1JGI4_9BURK|nr:MULTISPECIES: LysR family transcriptional regulator [Paraburkholderia]MBB5469590.1 DNA-binding transcriptional LysR family regulator [Paraburkholderia sp. CI2]MBC8742195.1 LysR family transcriptional regulator [Paraburkholderia sp. UCT31]SDR49012.1 transcriptional regulator, LysR family [Paraburkholderia tuberum]
MELKQIQYFIALFEEGTVTRAAKRLNIAQPALSMQISKLEAEVRQTLFARGPHGMAPTEAARLMYRLYTPIMRDIKHAREHLSRRDVIVTGRVSLGMVSSEAQSVLPESLARFDALFPQVEVSVADGFSAQLIDAVEAGRLDAAIINKPRGRLTLDVEPLLVEEMVLVTSAAHGPDLPETMHLVTQSGIEFVLPTRRNGLRGALDAALMAADVVIQPKFEIDLLSTIVQFVEQSSIATILPRVVVQAKVDEGLLRARTIDSPPIVRHIIQVTHPKRPIGPAAQALIAIITEEIRRVTTGARA